jgi:anaerobic magnesium-protoporphyrin IX monomethyl ester cyclase
MNDKLLIIGGTVTPYKSIQAEQDLLLRNFLQSQDSQSGGANNGDPADNFWLDLDGPYYPFKRAPIHQHRASQDKVTGLAELILQKEAADLGIPSDVVSLDEILNSRWQLTNPKLYDDYNLVAVSTTYLPSMLMLPVLEALRVPASAKMFVGGPGAAKVNHGALQNARFDYLLRTEAEGRFRLMLQHAQGQDIDLGTAVPGLTWRADGELRRSPQITAHLNLDELPLPDYSEMADMGGGRVLYESVRGCPYRCEFCDYPFLMGNKTFRYKGAQRIYEDWQRMHETMGVKDIMCLDSLFTVPPKRLLEVCDLMIESGLNKKMRWGCYARANDLAKLEFAERMREAGCEYVYVGFESGSDDVLKFMNKKCAVEHNTRAVENARKIGILTFGLFISGFPGETPEMFAKTRQFLRDSPPTVVSIQPWFPDVSEDTRVPIMMPDRIERFAIEVEKPSSRKVTMWKHCTFRDSVSVPWGMYWKHCGMDLQEAVDNVSLVIEDIYTHKIAAVSEELFFPRILDDVLNLFQRLGPDGLADFYSGLSTAVHSDGETRLQDFCQRVGLQHRPAAAE